jgi:surface polysaccharide O-acyltransferase-like enzyme
MLVSVLHINLPIGVLGFFMASALLFDSYRKTQVQAQVLAFMDDFRVLAAMYAALVFLVFMMRRVRPARGVLAVR